MTVHRVGEKGKSGTGVDSAGAGVPEGGAFLFGSLSVLLVPVSGCNIWHRLPLRREVVLAEGAVLAGELHAVRMAVRMREPVLP